jgi:hypothetical protein
MLARGIAMSRKCQLEKFRPKNCLIQVLRTCYYVYNGLLHDDLCQRSWIRTSVVESVQLADL